MPSSPIRSRPTLHPISACTNDYKTPPPPPNGATHTRILRDRVANSIVCHCAMLHQIKRTVGLAQQPLKGPANTEYLDLKQRLSTIKSALKYTSDMLDYANKGWVLQMQAQRTFSERFAESYPAPGDEMHLIASQFAEGSQRMYDHFIRKANPDMNAYHNIHHQVTVYIREIEMVESYHQRLVSAKSEADRYQSKIDHMERKKKQTDASKKTRNLLKMDVERQNYKNLLAEVITLQKKTYAKHPVVFKAALVSYWLSHEKHVTMLVESLKETQTFAKAAEVEMASLDIKNLEVPFQTDLQMNHKVFTDAKEAEQQRENHLQEMSSSFGNRTIPKGGSGIQSDVTTTISDAEQSGKLRFTKTRSLVPTEAEQARRSQRQHLHKTQSLKESTQKALSASNQQHIEIDPVLSQQLEKSVPVKGEEVTKTRSLKEHLIESAIPEYNQQVEKTQSLDDVVAVKTVSTEEGLTTTTGYQNSNSSTGEPVEKSVSRNESIDIGPQAKVIGKVEEMDESLGIEDEKGEETFAKEKSMSFNNAAVKTPLEEQDDLVLGNDGDDLTKPRTVKVIAKKYEAGAQQSSTAPQKKVHEVSRSFQGGANQSPNPSQKGL